MKTSHVWLTAYALGLAGMLVQCQESSEPSPPSANQASEPDLGSREEAATTETADPTPPPPQAPNKPATTTPKKAPEDKGPRPVVPPQSVIDADPVAALISTVKSAPTFLFVVEADGTEAVAAALKEAEVPFENLPKRKNIAYRFQKVIPHLRKHDSLWMVYSTSDQRTLDELRNHPMNDHRTDLRHRFGDLLLVKVANEIPEGSRIPRKIGLEKLDSKPGSTTNLQFTKDGETLFIASRRGLIHFVSMKDDASGLVLKLPSFRRDGEGVNVGGESGLVGMTLHPQFETNPKLYTYYNWMTSDRTRTGVISEWTVEISEAPKSYVAGNERKLLVLEQEDDTHNAGQLVFGPSDGYLYIGVGDGLIGGYAKPAPPRELRAPPHLLRGKVLRIDVDSRVEGKEYGIPDDNPFVNHEEIPPETWAWGFRNPWRMAFTPDGRLIAGDIGEDTNEEITFVRKGKHHGWPYIEGANERLPYPYEPSTLEPTLLAYGRELGMSVIAGFVYTSEEISWLTGKYVFADYLTGRLWAIDLPAPGEERSLAESDLQDLGRWPILFTTFAQDPQGNLYVSDPTGTLYRLREPIEGEEETIGATETMDVALMRAMFEAEQEVDERPELQDAEITLGKMLYEDPRLSSNGQVSCATCHPLNGYGQDGRRVSVNAAGNAGTRNTPTTFNAHRQFKQFWDCRAATVEELVSKTLLDEHGLESADQVAQILTGVPEYQQAFAKAYPNSDSPVTADNTSRAIGAFVRQLTTRSRWDDFLDGDNNALTTEEKRGLSLFISTGCVSCHRYRTVGGSAAHKLGLMAAWQGEDEGMAAVSGQASQKYYFKVSPLLNVGQTAPYFHDGSEDSLAESIRFMARTQLAAELTEDQVQSMVTFLEALTGEPPAILD